MIRNMDYNIAAMLMLVFVFVYFFTQYDIKSKSSKFFLRLLGCIFITSALNILCDFLLTILNPSIFLYTLYSIYLVFTILCAFILTEYTRVIVKPNGELTVYDIINHILLGCYILSCIATIPMHFYVSLVDSKVFRGDAYIVIYLLSAYYLIFAFFRMIKYFKVLSKRQTHGVISFVIITCAGAVLQFYVFGDQMLIYFIYAISCLILLFAFETPDYQKLIKTTEELRLNKEKLELSKQKEEDLSRTIHQLMKTSSWIINFEKDGNVKEVSWSDEIRKLLGYSQDDIIDVATLWTDSLHPDDKEMALNAFSKGLKGGIYRSEARLRYKNGTYHWFLCTGSLNKDSDGKPISYQGVIQNIDDEIYKRELINERLKAMIDLENSQEELKQALFDAQEANRAKTTFLSNMSHDIRTPMNAIIGYAQLAVEHISDKDEVLDCLNTIRSSGDHLLSLINDVLDMSRIESGKVKVEATPCNLAEIIKEIESLTKANVSERHQSYETFTTNLTEPYVMCDRLRLNQVLINCVGNAVKYTPEGGHIKVTLSQADTSDPNTKKFTFKIIDDGIGMSEEFLQRVFEPFERAKDSTTSSIQGTGLGMAITQNLVQMMGGTISAESELGKGSTFIITLPLPLISKDEYISSKELLSDGITMEEMVEALSGRKFLVVDDNKINRTIVKRLLNERGMHVDECDSGAKAIEIARNMNADTYDMIFMDIRMPIMDGYEASDAIRNLDNEVAKQIPIIAMTANAFEEDKKMAQEHGMNGHVTKPFKLDELINFLYNKLIYNP